MNRLISFVMQAADQAAKAATVVGWLLRVVFKARGTKLGGAAVLAGLHVAGQGAAILALFWCVRELDTTDALRGPMLGIEFPLQGEPALSWAAVAIVGFVASAGFLFWSRQLILRIVEAYYAESVARLVLAADRLPDSRARAASELLIEYGLGGLTTYCRHAALTAMFLANAISSVIGGVAAAMVLFFIDPLLTAAILAATGVGAILLYPLALRAASMEKFRERTRAAFQEEVRRLRQLGPPPETVAALATSKDLARSYFGRRRVTNELFFAIGIGITGLFGLVLYRMASQATLGQADWAVFIAYIGLLRLTLASAASAIRGLASLGRYYPQLARYAIFAQDAERLDDMPFGKLKAGETLTLGTLPDGADIVVKPGMRLAVVTTQSTRDVRFALLHARSAHWTPPLGTAMLRPANGSAGDATIALADANQFAGAGEDLAATLDGLHAGQVALIIHQTPSAVGSFGEQYLLTLEAGTFRAFLPLGTSESNTVLEHYSRKATTQRRRELYGADDEEMDEE
jgi:hypothetical protein